MFKELTFTALITFTVSGCATIGPTVLIETPKPAQDFVVICSWYQVPLLAFHGGGRLTNEYVYIADSGEEINCGIGAGDSATIKVMHPIYIDPEIIEQGNTLVYRYTKNKLEILNETKIKFDDGYWNNYKNPGYNYAHNLISCDFDHKYFDYYSEVRLVEVDYFKQLYHKPILKCLKKTFSVRKRYLPAFENYPSADDYIEKFWESEKWKEWNEKKYKVYYLP